MLSGCTVAAFCLAVAAGLAPPPRWNRILYAALAIDVAVLAIIFLAVVPRT